MIAAASLKDRQANAVAICEDGRVPEAQNSPALPLKISRPSLVIGDLIRMLAAIDLHDEARFGAVKVDDVRAAGDLALPPPATQTPIAKGSPEARLRLRILTPQTTGAIPLGRVPDGPDLGHGAWWVMAGPLCNSPLPPAKPRGERVG
jgi:hypothetical protein